MNKRTLYWIIGFICLSLAGIILVQYLWIRNAIVIREAQFDRSVNDALGMAVNKLETRENLNILSKNFVGDSMRTVIQAYARDTLISSSGKLDSMLTLEEEMPPPGYPIHSGGNWVPIPGTYYFDYNREMRYMDSVMDGMRNQILVEDPLVFNLEFNWDEKDMMRIDSMMRLQEKRDQSHGRNKGKSKERSRQEVIVDQPGRSIHTYYEFSVSPQANVYLKPPKRKPPPPSPAQQAHDRIKSLTVKARKLQDVIKKMAIEIETDSKPISERIGKKKLEKILETSFQDKDINLPFEFAIQSSRNDTVNFPIQSEGFNGEFRGNQYRTSLFPNDVFRKPEFLLVYFPNKQSHVLKSLSLVMVGSAFFTLFIILSSGMSIYFMIRQKKVSDIKTDFINNMTHEFKTPIATISIAADSINNQKVLGEPDTIRNFTRIIKEENNRMNSRVEQVLQMALLDSKDFRLKPVIVDMHYLIEKAIAHFRLQVEKRGGSISMELNADHSIVEADEDHMRNVLMNLLDNANKYSVVKPEILVFSFYRGGKFFFGVEDKGMGMTSDTQRKVFDKFFRITTGNIHNIKGFGLGLSYCKAIVLAHKGAIQVTSEVGKGSRFEINLPVIEKQTNHEQTD